MGGESEQKTKGRRKRRALVGLGGVDVTRSAANRPGKKDQCVRGRNETRKKKQSERMRAQRGDVAEREKGGSKQKKAGMKRMG